MYSAIVLEEFNRPHRRGPLEGATAQGQAGMPGEGPFAAVWLRVDEGKIVETSFESYTCPAATATVSWLTRWAEGRTVEQVGVMTPQMLMQVLGGLPLAKEHTAYLAVKALQAALQQATATPETVDVEGARP